MAEEWTKLPKPKVSVPPFEDTRNKEDFHARLESLLRLAVLALQTDSTRLITVKIDLTGDYHNRSHHGLNEEEILTNATTGAPERVTRGGNSTNPADTSAVSHRSRYGPASRTKQSYGLRVARLQT